MIYLLLAFLLLLGSILLLPIGLEWDYSERGGKWAVVWLGMRIGVTPVWRRVFTLFGSREGETAQKPARRKEQRAEATREERTAETTSVRDIVEMMTSGVQAFQHGVEVLRSFGHHLKIKVHRLEIVVATPNPALTGFAYGLAYAVGSGFASSVPWTLVPEFTLTRPAISFRVEASITLIKVIPSILRLTGFAIKEAGAHWWVKRKDKS